LAEDFFKRFEEALQTQYAVTASAAPHTGNDALSAAHTPSDSSATSVPGWVWLALVVGAGAVWYLVR